MSNRALQRARKDRDRLQKQFEDAVGPVREHYDSFEMYMRREDVLTLTGEESDEWASQCYRAERMPIAIKVEGVDRTPIQRAKHALACMGQTDGDRLSAEIAYGSALIDLKAECQGNNNTFGERVVAEGLDRYTSSQLGTTKEVIIKRDTRSGCMWLAANEDVARKMLADGANANTARGLHKLWKAAQADKVVPLRPEPKPDPLPDLSTSAQEKLEKHKRVLEAEVERRVQYEASKQAKVFTDEAKAEKAKYAALTAKTPGILTSDEHKMLVRLLGSAKDSMGQDKYLAAEKVVKKLGKYASKPAVVPSVVAEARANARASAVREGKVKFHWGSTTHNAVKYWGGEAVEVGAKATIQDGPEKGISVQMGDRVLTASGKMTVAEAKAKAVAMALDVLGAT